MSDQNHLTAEQNRHHLDAEHNEQSTQALDKDEANETNLHQNETNEDNSETLHTGKTSEPSNVDDTKSLVSNEGKVNQEKESEGTERVEGTLVKMEETRQSQAAVTR